jgi:hypothetical protein
MPTVGDRNAISMEKTKVMVYYCQRAKASYTEPFDGLSIPGNPFIKGETS